LFANESGAGKEPRGFADTGFMTQVRSKVTQLARKRRRVNPLVLARWIMRQKRL